MALLARWLAQLRGSRAESAAMSELVSAGLVLVARNFRTRQGEIDLVMRDGVVLVFVEVRYRGRTSFVDGIASIDAGKRKRLIAAARQFVQEHPEWRLSPQRFDAVSMGQGETRWVRSMFVVDC